MRKPRLSLADLRKHDGKGGARALVAVRGLVYDVSGSFLWQKGRHQALHDAGRDLTAALDEAPHDAALLARFPVVGRLGPGLPVDSEVRPAPGPTKVPRRPEPA
jgi:predicted heme/steroid binding protein